MLLSVHFLVQSSTGLTTILFGTVVMFEFRVVVFLQHWLTCLSAESAESVQQACAAGMHHAACSECIQVACSRLHALPLPLPLQWTQINVRLTGFWTGSDARAALDRLEAAWKDDSGEGTDVSIWRGCFFGFGFFIFA